LERFCGEEPIRINATVKARLFSFMLSHAFTAITISTLWAYAIKVLNAQSPSELSCKSKARVELRKKVKRKESRGKREKSSAEIRLFEK